MENQKCECITHLARKNCKHAVGQEECEIELYEQALLLPVGIYYREFSGTGDLVKLVVKTVLQQSQPAIIGLILKINYQIIQVSTGNSREFIALCLSKSSRPITYEQFEAKSGRYVDAVKIMINANTIKL